MKRGRHAGETHAVAAADATCWRHMCHMCQHAATRPCSRYARPASRTRLWCCRMHACTLTPLYAIPHALTGHSAAAGAGTAWLPPAVSAPRGCRAHCPTHERRSRGVRRPWPRDAGGSVEIWLTCRVQGSSRTHAPVCAHPSTSGLARQTRTTHALQEAARGMQS